MRLPRGCGAGIGGASLAFWNKKGTPPPALPEIWTPSLWDEFSRKYHEVNGFVGLDAMNIRCDMSDVRHTADVEAQFAGRLGADKHSPLKHMRVSVEFNPLPERSQLAGRFGEEAMGYGQTMNWGMDLPPSLHLRVFGASEQRRALEELFVRAKLLRMPHVTMNFWGTVVEPWWDPKDKFARVFSLSRVIFVQNLSLTGDVEQESAAPWP